MHDGDAVLPVAMTRLAHAHELNVGEVLQRASLLDVELDSPPQLLVCSAQQGCSLTHRQIQGRCQGQSLERVRKAGARARPRQAHLVGLAATAARNLRHGSVRLGLKLVEVQVQPAVHEPRGYPASREGNALAWKPILKGCGAYAQLVTDFYRASLIVIVPFFMRNTLK